jgi:aspartyl-tRNA(Asn)/glutamyl-tRNA(Gln) amidotransferase subunit B
MIRRLQRPSSPWKLGRTPLTLPRVELRHFAASHHLFDDVGNESGSIPYRQQLKHEIKQRKRHALENRPPYNKESDGDANWELTVGIEIHAQLDTERKLFSNVTTSTTNEPNSKVALCDLAYPGAQPIFQVSTLLPALRAAIALNCDIQRKSTFDRKHYFYPDQPAGYQITQFYG